MARNEYVLHIDIENIQSSNSKAKAKLDATTGKNTGKDDKQKDKLNKAVKALGKKVTMTATNDVVKPMVDFQINSYSARYGNSVRANTIRNAQSVVDAGIDIGGMALAGASVGGGWGALIGAALGIVGKGVEIVQNVISYDSKQEVHKFEEIRASERLGLQLSDRNRGK